MNKEVDLSAVGRLTDEIVRDVSRESGLRDDTVRDLLEKGWTYRKEFREPDKWIKRF